MPRPRRALAALALLAPTIASAALAAGCREPHAVVVVLDPFALATGARALDVTLGDGSAAATPERIDLEDGISEQATMVLVSPAPGSYLIAVAALDGDGALLAEASTQGVFTADGGRATARLFQPCDTAPQGSPCSLEDGAGTGRCVSAVCTTAELCGDAALGADEECDTGSGNVDAVVAVAGDCRADCTIAACGDLRVDADEGCDDGGAVDGDGCSALCVAEECGDELVNNVDEECDDGEGNATPAAQGGCRTDCTRAACGDGIVDLDEQCDDGNALALDGCSPDCEDEVCGDGLVSGTDECEPATPGVTAPCDYQSAAAPTCQSCDGDTCAFTTLVAPFCGDGIAQGAFGETCDDGNTASFDGCSATCRRVIWGPLSVGPSIDSPIIYDFLGTFTDPLTAPTLIYARSGDDIVALDAATGAERWRVTLTGIVGDPTVVPGGPLIGGGEAESRVVVTTATHFVTLEGVSGATIAASPLPVPPANGPTAPPFLLAAALGTNGVVYSTFIDAVGAEPVGVTSCPECLECPTCKPTIIDGNADAILIGADGAIVMFNPLQNCRRRHSLPNVADTATRVAFAGGRGIAVTELGTLITVSADPGCSADVPATVALNGVVASSNPVFVASGGDAFVGDVNGNIWTVSIFPAGFSRVIATVSSGVELLALDGELDLYVLDDENDLHKLSSLSGASRYSFDVDTVFAGLTPIGAPLVGGQAIYLASTDGRVIALEGGGSVAQFNIGWSRDVANAAGSLVPAPMQLCGSAGAAPLPVLAAVLLLSSVLASGRRRSVGGDRC